MPLCNSPLIHTSYLPVVFIPTLKVTRWDLGSAHLILPRFEWQAQHEKKEALLNDKSSSGWKKQYEVGLSLGNAGWWGLWHQELETQVFSMENIMQVTCWCSERLDVICEQSLKNCCEFDIIVNQKVGSNVYSLNASFSLSSPAEGTMTLSLWATNDRWEMDTVGQEKTGGRVLRCIFTDLRTEREPLPNQVGVTKHWALLRVKCLISTSSLNPAYNIIKLGTLCSLRFRKWDLKASWEEVKIWPQF